jgi:hypothetical protein
MRYAMVLVLLVTAAGCSSAQPADVAFGGASDVPVDGTETSAAPAPQDADGVVAWRHLGTTEGMLEGSAAAAAVESQRELEAAWNDYGLPGAVPDVDFDRAFVLLLGQPDDACIDELIGVDVANGALDVTWLPPPGGCDEPLIFRIHAVEVDRRYLPEKFTVVFPDPYDGDAKPVTITVRRVAGEPPPAPEPPAAMAEEDVDAVFAGHAVQRCRNEAAWRDDRQVDGPLSDDAKVAEAQKRRAQYGVASDEGSTRAAMANPAEGEPMGFPITEAELRQDSEASQLTDKVRAWLGDEGYRPNRDFVPYLSRSDGIRPGVLVDGGNTDEIRGRLDEQFGKGAVVVVEHAYDFEAVDKAQRDLGSLMGGEGPGSIVSSTGVPGPVEIGMIDPTREALDRIASTVDPSLVCVSPVLSGVSANVGRP